MTKGALDILGELREDAKIGKNKHFHASERKLGYHYRLGIPVIAINIFIVVVVIYFLGLEPEPDWASGLAVVLAFLAAFLSALQTFFNYQKASDGHRAIGNRYLDVSRRCKNLLRKFDDSYITKDELWQAIDIIEKQYKVINSQAESFPTNKKDLASAVDAKEITPFKNLSQKDGELTG